MLCEREDEFIYRHTSPCDFFLQKGVERNRHRLASEVAKDRAGTEFFAYGKPMTDEKNFKYLGIMFWIKMTTGQ